MIQILPPLNYLGQNQSSSGFGEDLLKGIGSGLQELAHNKTNEFKKRREVEALHRIGFSPQESEILGYIKEVNPQQYSEYLGRALENIGSRSSQQQFQQQPQEFINEQIKAPNGKEVSVQEEISKPVQSKGLFEKGLSEKEKAERFKSSKEFRESVLQARKTARSDLRDLGRLEELSESGKLDTPGYIEFLKESGFDIPALQNPESEEFAKIQQSFLKNAKNYFGGRISNYEVEQFLKTIPSLSQSPEGRKRVIANLKYMARGAQEYYNAYEDVLKKNGGVPPHDVEEEVERIIDKRIDKLADQFKKDIAKPVPKGQNKFITALQSGAGKVVSTPFNIIKGIGNIGKSVAPILPV